MAIGRLSSTGFVDFLSANKPQTRTPNDLHFLVAQFQFSTRALDLYDTRAIRVTGIVWLRAWAWVVVEVSWTWSVPRALGSTGMNILSRWLKSEVTARSLQILMRSTYAFEKKWNIKQGYGLVMLNSITFWFYFFMSCQFLWFRVVEWRLRNFVFFFSSKFPLEELTNFFKI